MLPLARRSLRVALSHIEREIIEAYKLLYMSHLHAREGREEGSEGVK